MTNGNTSHNSSTTGVIVNNTNSATEREHLVRTLASVLHSAAASQTRRGAAKTGSPAPSSNVQDKHTERTGEEHLAKAAERLELAGALVSFLPPARRDGLQGVTGDSVALRPDWCAPSTVTANVCSCLLHLLGGKETGAIAKQVCKACAGGAGQSDMSFHAGSYAWAGAEEKHQKAPVRFALKTRLEVSSSLLAV